MQHFNAWLNFHLPPTVWETATMQKPNLVLPQQKCPKLFLCIKEQFFLFLQTFSFCLLTAQHVGLHLARFKSQRFSLTLQKHHFNINQSPAFSFLWFRVGLVLVWFFVVGGDGDFLGLLGFFWVNVTTLCVVKIEVFHVKSKGTYKLVWHLWNCCSRPSNALPWHVFEPCSEFC